MPSRSAEILREVEALLMEEGAKAAAEPARRESTAVVFMVIYLNKWFWAISRY